MSKKNKDAGWKELPIGGVITEGGTAKKYKTGDWRSERPIWDKDKCIQCLLCWIYCPDSAIKIKDGKVVGIDLDHCKGCGICAEQCPAKPEKAIKMESERESE